MSRVYHHLADNGTRLKAYLIDIIPITGLVFGVYYLFLGFDVILEEYLNRGEDIFPRVEFMEQRNLIRDVSFLVWMVYCIVFEASKMQGTFGKSIMGIKVVDVGGGRISLVKSMGRNLSKILSYFIFVLGFIWILFDKKHQGWHDKLNGTFVVSKTIEDDPLCNT